MSRILVAIQRTIKHVFSQPVNPQQNTYVERFNRTVRYECLTQQLFLDIEDVQNGFVAQRFKK